ncbi:MAG TPA: DUF5990 family protein [Anaerolineae bacterium]
MKIRLVCPDTVKATVAGGGFVFGLQDVDQVVHQGKRFVDDSLLFECELKVKLDDASKTVRFYGAFVHGPPTDRFMYLSWKHKVTTDGLWIRRLKVPLSGVTWKQVSGMKEGQSLQCRISEQRKGARAIVDWAVV